MRNAKRLEKEALHDECVYTKNVKKRKCTRCKSKDVVCTRFRGEWLCRECLCPDEELKLNPYTSSNLGQHVYEHKSYF